MSQKKIPQDHATPHLSLSFFFMTAHSVALLGNISYYHNDKWVHLCPRSNTYKRRCRDFSPAADMSMQLRSRDLISVLGSLTLAGARPQASERASLGAGTG